MFHSITMQIHIFHRQKEELRFQEKRIKESQAELESEKKRSVVLCIIELSFHVYDT